MMTYRRTTALAATLSAVLLLPASAAFADGSDDVTFSVQGAASAEVTAPTFSNFGTITLDGTRKTVTTSAGDWSVTDATGTGAGWTVNVEATAPENGDGSRTLDHATVSLTAPAVSAADAQNGSAAPTVGGGNILQTGGRTVASADEDAGMGVWDFTQGGSDLSLTVPSDAYADSYTTTITTTISAAAG